MFAHSLTLNGVLNTTGMGCQAGEGFGKGDGYNESCTSSGGSHGGYGGLAINYATRKINTVRDSPEESDKYNDSICQGYVPSPYNRYDSPAVSEGSGGGIA